MLVRLWEKVGNRAVAESIWSPESISKEERILTWDRNSFSLELGARVSSIKDANLLREILRFFL